MTTTTKTLSALLITTATLGCAVTSHEVTPARLGSPTSSDALVSAAATPGPVRLTRVQAARWVVERGGLINLEHPEAQAAGLEEGEEPIEIVFYALEHPTRGTWLVDSGVAAVFRDAPDEAPVSAMVASAMNTEALEVTRDTASWIEAHGPIDGVLLTHLHLDHVMGMPDIPAEVPIYVGPGETEETTFLNLFVQGTTDDMLGERAPLQELVVPDDPDGALEGALDLFGDGSVYVLHVPGHTAGSLAFLVRTPTGPQLITGDASHTAWGWDHHVEPGTFNNDTEGAARSLARLKALEAKLPGLVVHTGHTAHRSSLEAGTAMREAR